MTPLPSHHGQVTFVSVPPRPETTFPVPRQGAHGLGSAGVCSLTWPGRLQRLQRTAPPADRPYVARARSPHPRADDGFTLIEVLVTILLVSGAMLALLAIVDRGNATTSDNLNREAATNVAREIVEHAHATGNYAGLTTAGAATTLRNVVEAAGTRGSSTPAGGSWTMNGRVPTVRLNVSVSACTVPVRSSQPIVIPATDTYCAPPPGNPTAPPPTTDTGSSGPCQVQGVYDPALGLRIKLLVDISLCVNGDLAKAVCTLLGPTRPLTAFLDPLIGPDGAVNVLLNGLGGSTVGTTLCGGKPVVVDTTTRTDVNPGRRIITTVSWSRPGSSGTVTQTTVVPRPVTA